MEHKPLDCVFGKNKYGSYCMPANCAHRPAVRMVQNGEVYEPDTIQFMLNNHDNKRIITAGTFFGDFLPALASTGTEVFAYEPVETNYRCAKITLDMNYTDHNVHLRHGALGKTNEQLEIAIANHNGQPLGGASNFQQSKHVPKSSRETVNVYAIDQYVEFFRAPLGIIQLDVEGHEEMALRGALDVIKRWQPILILEQWSPKMFDTEFFEKDIFALGYKTQGKLHENVVLSV